MAKIMVTILIVLYCLFKKAFAPALIAWLISTIALGPVGDFLMYLIK
jgi:hypothetical protein